MQELRGMPVVKNIAEKLTAEIDELKAKGVTPTLAVVRVGEREDDLSYERGVIKRFDGVGAKVENKVLPADVTQEELEKVIVECNNDRSINGVLLFRPLPKHLDEKKIIDILDPSKDMDCMCLENIAHTFAQDGQGYEPCTPRAVMEMLYFYGIDLKGKDVVVVGRSMVVGKPLAMMLLAANATVTVCHTKTKDLKEKCKAADIVCACAGVAKMLDAEYITPGTIVIDVGINVVDGKLCGDVDYESVSQIAEAITPVPGGVGTVTTSVLLQSVVDSAKKMLHNIL